MPYAIQYSQDSGATFQQFGITTADITLNTGIATKFSTCKDSKDNTYICLSNSEIANGNNAKILRIDKNGNKASLTISRNRSGYYLGQIQISRDELKCCAVGNGTASYSDSVIFVDIPLNFVDGASYTPNIIGYENPGIKFALYQDRYIWVASGSTVKIYNYETKAELASYSFGGKNYVQLICDIDNSAYLLAYDCSTKLYKFTFDTVGNIITQNQVGTVNFGNATARMVIDKWRDFVIMSSNGSLMAKYSRDGQLIGGNVSLGGSFANLNTDKDGNYYYSNAIGTYKVPKNTAQGQAIAPLNQHVKIRDNGMTTFGNNISGYNPSVFE